MGPLLATHACRQLRPRRRLSSLLTTLPASLHPFPRLQVNTINSTPSWLLALVGVFCCIGPLTLAGFFTWEKVLKKD